MLVPLVRTQDGRLLLSPHFGSAMLYAILEVKDNECKIVDTYEFGPQQPGGRGRVIVPWALQRGVQAVVAREMGYGAYEGFASNGVRVCYATSLDPCQAARDCLEGKAPPLQPSPGHGRGRGGHGWGRHGYQWG